MPHDLEVTDTPVAARKRGLGRGLSALFDDSEAELLSSAATAAGSEPGRELRMPGIDQLTPGRFQPRRAMQQESLDELAASIAVHGILQPIVVRRLGGDGERFEIIAGERRWRAAQKAGLHKVPVLVKDLSDDIVLQVALIENLQREDLNAIEEALAYKRLTDEFGHSQEKLAAAMGKSRSHVANTLRLLTLPDAVIAEVGAGRLSAGHARALVTAAEPERLMQEILANGLSVREAEKLAAAQPSSRSRKGQQKTDKDIDTLALEAEISAKLGMTVVIDMAGKDGGSVKIAFRSLDQLDELLRLVSRSDGGRIAN